MKKQTNIWDRLLEALKADNLDDAAQKLDINASTLRGRKARGAIPYKNIVHNLDTADLIYVLKNEKLNKIGGKYSGNPAWKEESALLQKIRNSDELSHESTESVFEHFLVNLTQRIEDAPFSNVAKLQLIDSLVRIAEEDLEKKIQNKDHSDPD